MLEVVLLLRTEAATGKIKWRYEPEMPNDYFSTVCCGMDNRGVAYANGRIFFGRLDAKMEALDAKTGAVKWQEKSIRPGALMAADGKLIIMGDTGELVVAQAAPESFKPLARAQVLGGKCWTVPTLSHGRIYARNAKGDLVCVDASGKATASRN